MLWGDIYLAGIGTCLPEAIRVTDAIQQGRYDETEAATTMQLSACVADSAESAPQLAVKAGAQALQQSGRPVRDVGALLHAVVLHAGLDVWNSASYVQRELAIPDPCFVSEVRSACAGAMVGLELASSYLQVHAERPDALITAADIWADGTFDRWRSNRGFVFADGGVALLISREGGFARLVATATTSDTSMEAMIRGDEPFGMASAAYPIDLDRRATAFCLTMPRSEVVRRYQIGLRSVIDQITQEAGIGLPDVDHFVFQFMGLRALRRDYLDPLRIDLAKTTWEYGRRVGHLGAGDPIAGLHHVFSARTSSSGELTLVVGEGAGFIWTAALVETT